jgi:pimeloyl-ACP methyl ester carboxylesterase
MDIILVPGLWLDGSSWDEVVPLLEQAGARTHAVTLPGMRASDTDRAAVTLSDHVNAVVAVIDSVDPAGQVVLVGHSAGSAIAYAAVDARPDRVHRVIYVGGFPVGDGDSLAPDFAAENGEVPLPDWTAFDEEELAGLNEEALSRFRQRALPSPERVTRDVQRLFDNRRYGVPATVVCTEFSADTLREWIEQGEEAVQEFTKIRTVEYVDLPTGHWPQFSQPQQLAEAILRASLRPAR